MHRANETQITKVLMDDEAVRGLVLIGSRARSDVVPDAWSDLDLAVVIDDKSVGHYYPRTDWTAQFGDTYAFASSCNEHFSSTRVQYNDGLRVDFVIIPESSLESIDCWAQNPFQFGNRCLFSRSRLLDQVLQRTYPERVLQKSDVEQLEQMANDFRFKGMLAATKAARNELLVALHLGLDMIRDCLVLAMMVRDQATGTDHHRDGSQGNHLIEPLILPLKEYTAPELLNSIERSAIAFGSLALQLNSAYEDRREPLLNYIAQVRAALSMA